MLPSVFEQLEQTSDAIDEGGERPSLSWLVLQSLTPILLFVVNQLKGCLWDSQAEFSKEKDTTAFRQYADACDRVKSFYQEQHG